MPRNNRLSGGFEQKPRNPAEVRVHLRLSYYELGNLVRALDHVSKDTDFRELRDLLVFLDQVWENCDEPI